MVFNVQVWIDELVSKIQKNFADRVVFTGPQGSYRRNEATEKSDIDIILILDELDYSDLATYRAIVAGMPNAEKACGFVSGVDEIKNWERSELFQFYHDTKPILKDLDFLLPLIDEEQIKRAVKIAACGIYHGCCHNVIFDKNPEILSSLYKSAFFILQALCFLKTGQYISSKPDLAETLDGTNLQILQSCMGRAKMVKMEMDELVSEHETLMQWSSNLIQNY
jgi:hypothetical protein